METHFELIEQTLREEAPGRLIGHLRTLAASAEDLINATAGEVTGRAKEAQVRLAAALRHAKATCQEVEKRAAAGAKAADKAIRDHPYPSVGIAFSLGLMIGLLTNRR